MSDVIFILAWIAFYVFTAGFIIAFGQNLPSASAELFRIAGYSWANSLS